MDSLMDEGRQDEGKIKYSNGTVMEARRDGHGSPSGR
jgi:hypothetical protein